jgi:thiamine pyrophosphokinase
MKNHLRKCLLQNNKKLRVRKSPFQLFLILMTRTSEKKAKALKWTLNKLRQKLSNGYLHSTCQIHLKY